MIIRSLNTDLRRQEHYKTTKLFIQHQPSSKPLPLINYWSFDKFGFRTKRMTQDNYDTNVKRRNNVKENKIRRNFSNIMKEK